MEDFYIMKKRNKIVAFLLAVLAAYAGQKVHIYNEDPAHFAAFSGDLVPDNGAEQQIVEFCIVNLENGMAVSIGRLRPDTQYDYKFVCLSHNTLRGAAGGAVLLAELLAAEGYMG